MEPENRPHYIPNEYGFVLLHVALQCVGDLGVDVMSVIIEYLALMTMHLQHLHARLPAMLGCAACPKFIAHVPLRFQLQLATGARNMRVERHEKVEVDSVKRRTFVTGFDMLQIGNGPKTEPYFSMERGREECDTGPHSSRRYTEYMVGGLVVMTVEGWPHVEAEVQEERRITHMMLRRQLNGV